MTLRCSLSYHYLFSISFLYLSADFSSSSAFVSTRQPTLSGNRDALYRLAGALSLCKKKGKEKLPSNLKSTGFINPSLFGRYVIIIASSTWNHSHKQKISIEHRRWSLILLIIYFIFLFHFTYFPLFVIGLVCVDLGEPLMSWGVSFSDDAFNLFLLKRCCVHIDNNFKI